MNRGLARRSTNLVLSGGGIKGIAYIGMFEVAEEKGFSFENIAGVSAGALVGSLKGAGYKAAELRKILYEFEFDKIKTEDIPDKVPVVRKFIKYCKNSRLNGEDSFKSFLDIGVPENNSYGNNTGIDEEFKGHRGNFFKNIITYSKEGCLYDGDYLEEWIYKVLKQRGIRTFADFRTGKADKSNPNGYRVRMTAVDANRGRVIVLPDDISYYGIDPDRLEVAKAVRMSTCVPFAFKPVELYKKEGNTYKKHYIVDGGILDNFPLWLVEPSNKVPLIGCRLESRNKKKLFSIWTPLNILKGLISSVHDFGIPKVHYKNCYIIKVDTSDVSFLDFNLSDKEKEYLINSGRASSLYTFNKIIQMNRMRRCNILTLIGRILGIRY
ncbi:MAG: patatin-like phospholipase family protein [Bacillota bacterium]